MDGKINPRSEKGIKIVNNFCNIVLDLKVIDDIYQNLFEDEKTIRLLDQTASLFFHDINKIIIHQYLLEIVKLTDPAISGKEENFTVDFIIEKFDWNKTTMEKLEKLRSDMEIREYLKKARNKILAHYDTKTVLDGKPIGSFPEKLEKDFLEKIEEFCQIIYFEATNSNRGKMLVPRSGDVRSIIRVLRKSLAFDQLLKDARDKEKLKLLSMVKENAS